MEPNSQVNIRHFNQYQNMVVVHDSNGNGKLDATDKAIAQKNFTLDVPEDAGRPNGPRKEISFKAGDEVPFQRYQFLLKNYKANAAQSWAETSMQKRLQLTREPRLQVSPSALEVLKKNGFGLETNADGETMLNSKDGKDSWNIHGSAESDRGNLIRTQKAILSTVANRPNALKIVALEDDGSTHVYLFDAKKRDLQELTSGAIAKK